MNSNTTANAKNKAFTLSISREKLDNLNLDISLASSDLQLVKKIKVTDVNDAFCYQILLKNFIIQHFIYLKNNIEKIKLH